MAKFSQILEDLLFRHRWKFLVVLLVGTLLMLLASTRTHIDAGFAKMIPQEHPFIRTFNQHSGQFGTANRVLIAVMARDGDIYSPAFLHKLQEATSRAANAPGADRSQLRSLFTPNVRYIEITEEGFAGGNVIPGDFEATPEMIDRVRENVRKSGEIGRLVTNDGRGAMVSLSLLEIDPQTDQRLDYGAVARYLQREIREPLERDGTVTVQIIGFAQAVGDITAGTAGVLTFFGIAILITAGLMWLYAHSVRLTLWPLLCSVVAVVWQLGLLNLLGFGIDPLSILVPFLVFAIGMSHGIQMVRSFRTGVSEQGLDARGSARRAFRHLLMPGSLALITDCIGFLTLWLIEVRMIRELAISASLGVAAIILTNLILLPLLLSFTELPRNYSNRARQGRLLTVHLWDSTALVARPAVSIVVLLAGGVLAWYGFSRAGEVRIGDLHRGVPELRPESRYNRDAVAISENFSIGVDVFTVFVEAFPNAPIDFPTMDYIDRLAAHLQQTAGVQSVISLPQVARLVNSAWNEGNPRWRVLPRDQQLLQATTKDVETATGLLNADGSVLPIYAFLESQKAETLQTVVAAVQDFVGRYPPPPQVKVALAGGNAGVTAAVNQLVSQAQVPMLWWTFGAIGLLVFLTFRSWQAVLCICTPLALVSLLCYAVMVELGIGLKVSTLPVVTLGVGIGVDYGIYLYARLIQFLEAGHPFDWAVRETFQRTGSAVLFTGLTLAIGVGAWYFSDLKFQADMGLLLAFMFFVNMVGALFLLPALARWLVVPPWAEKRPQSRLAALKAARAAKAAPQSP